MPDSNDTFVGLTKSRAALGLSVIAILMSALSAFSAVITLDRTSQQAAAGARAQVGLCAIRADDIRSVKESEAYLLKHPNGAPAIGLSRAYILRSIQQKQGTLTNLRSLGC